jgi:hypothetical protein
MNLGPVPVPAPGPVTPIISASPVVLVKKPYTSKPTRQPVMLSTDQAFDGLGTFTVTSGAGKVRFFTDPVGGIEIQSGEVFPGGDLSSTITIFAQGENPSAAEKDITLQLSLTPGSKPVNPPATDTMTSVEVTLDICRSRTKAGVDPDLVDDKINAGRIVHVQTGNFHGRALVIIRKANPKSFSGKLCLSAINDKNGRVCIFADSQEVAKAGETGALRDPYEIANPSITAPGVKLWAEGAAVSNALRDTGFRLGVSGVDPDGDRVAMTVIRFKRFKADIPSTPANTSRAKDDTGTSNSPVPRHTLMLAPGALAASDFDDDFTNNPPLPLVEGSIKNADPIILSVVVQPAGVTVSWAMERYKDAAKGDHHDIKNLAGNSDDPGLVQDKGDCLKATLKANGVGSYHVRPYVDCNGSKQFEGDDATGARIDREPYILMNLVLIRVQGFNNLCLANSAAGSPTLLKKNVDLGPPLGVRNVPERVNCGDFLGTGNDAVTMKATAQVIGGGPDGKVGLDRLFAGWVNNELDCVTSPSPAARSEDVTHHFQRPMPAPLPLLGPVLPVPPTRKTRCFWKVNGVEIGGPILDSGYDADQGTGGHTCTSTSGGNNYPCRCTKTDDPGGIGQRWLVENWDSPGGDVLVKYPGADDPTATLRRFTFNLNFRSDLVFWTNRKGVSGPDDAPACRLYSTVQTNYWWIQLESDFDDSVVETVGRAKTVTFLKDEDATRQAKPVAGSGLETRMPDGCASLHVNDPF